MMMIAVGGVGVWGGVMREARGSGLTIKPCDCDGGAWHCGANEVMCEAAPWGGLSVVCTTTRGRPRRSLTGKRGAERGLKQKEEEQDSGDPDRLLGEGGREGGVGGGRYTKENGSLLIIYCIDARNLETLKLEDLFYFVESLCKFVRPCNLLSPLS